MRRKLIKQDAFDQITNESVTNAERELKEAAQILGKALGKKHLALHCFTESTVLYETKDKTFIHAGFDIQNRQLALTNIEELVIDESTRKQKMRAILSETLDHVLQDDHVKAKNLFSQYLNMVRWGNQNKSTKNEGTVHTVHAGNREKAIKIADRLGMREALETAENVLEYVEFVKVGPKVAESVIKTDDKGNVTDIKVPILSERNNNDIQRTKWRNLNCRNYEVRKSVPSVVEEQAFCKAMANLKRQNAFSDHQGLEEALEQTVKTWPNLIYVTQAELSNIIAEALQTAGVSNYDDRTCEFMAEGILRKAHNSYSEKVAQILHLASAPKLEANEDAYSHFQRIVSQFYPALDEKFGLERQAFSDLYESLTGIWKGADRRNDEALKSEAARYINELAAILNQEAKPEIGVVEESAKWIKSLVESNIKFASEKWDVSNKPHLTVNGDHPQMAKNSKVPAIPGSHEGEWGDAAPAIGQDNHKYKGGKNASTMRNNSWGQEGGKEVFPKLNNPYVPKPFGDYTMKGEKGVDKDATGQHWSTWSTGDTWPNLDNPYVPKEAGGEGGKGHKMKNGKDTDLVVDR